MILACSSTGRDENVCSLPSTRIANFPVVNRPTLVIRCCPSRTSRSPPPTTLK